jgi:hypothetical protein
MSRLSIRLTGGSFFVLGATIVASISQLWWIERIALPTASVLAFIAWVAAWFHDLKR